MPRPRSTDTPGARPHRRQPVRPATAEHHARTRHAHAMERAEDYVEAIGEMLDTHGKARVVELARALGVSHVTVVRTLARLRRLGLVSTRPYRSVFLTPRGRALAERSRERHEIVVRFLLAIGVSRACALEEAEGIEHHVSEETLRAMERATRKMLPVRRNRSAGARSARPAGGARGLRRGETP